MQTTTVSRSIGLFSLMMAGLTCIIGSGWLFGAYLATKLAGPAAIFSWIIGGVAMMLIALPYAELGAMFPKVGGMVRYMEYTHGSLTGYLSAWACWLAIITSTAVEAVASVQYLSASHWEWTHHLFNKQTELLSVTGLGLASLLLIGYFLINYWSVQLFIRSVVIITIVKVIVPVLTIILFLYAGFHPGNLTAYHHTLAPYGWLSIFTAIATSGVIYAFRGFQTIINLAGEAKSPSRNIPLSIVGALLFAMLLYVILQIVYIGAIDPQKLAALGWHNIVFSSPYVELAIILNLHFLVILLYIDAIISPSGTGIAYMGTTARMLYGMSRNGYMPQFMQLLHPKYLIPRSALWVNLIVCLIFLMLFRSWEKLVPVVSLVGVISYMSGPIAAIALRKLVDDEHRPIRLPLLKTIALLAHIILSLILFWGHWPLTGEVSLLIMSGLVIYIYYQIKQGWPEFGMQLKACLWFIFYLAAIAIISYLGSKQFGGKNIIPAGWDMLCVVIVAIISFYWSVKSAWMSPALAKIVSKLGTQELLIE